MPRIAFFPDSFHEVNGVAHTARQFVAFAQRRKIPMLCLYGGDPAGSAAPGPAGGVVALRRGRWSLPLEQDLTFDPLFFRHTAYIGRMLEDFRPDVVHITGPSELGILGAWFAWRLRVPLVASWHTNLHEYTGRRLSRRLRWLGGLGRAVSQAAENASLSAATRFYRLARVLYAPNPALCTLLQSRTGRPCHLMQRGVDTALFTPARRARIDSPPLTLGFVGRLSVEKNVALLPRINEQLRRRGLAPHWLVVGHGAEEEALRQALGSCASFPGVLRGEALAQAYANMDLFVFPSHTDTFGNVVLEALASGVPALVTPEGGPASIVHDGQTGIIAGDEDFADAVQRLAASPPLLAAMGEAARAYALQCSWDAVFERVLTAYPTA